MKAWKSPAYWKGLAVGAAVALSLEGWVVYSALRSARESLVPGCANNLKQIGLSLKMYANESSGMLYPSLSRAPGRLYFTHEAMYPEYYPDPIINLCPRDTDKKRLTENQESFSQKSWLDHASRIMFDDWSFFYLGYALRNDEDMERFAAAYRDHIRAGTAMEDDITVPGDPDGLQTIFRLRKDIALEMAARIEGDAASEPTSAGNIAAKITSEIPIVIERVGNHKQNGPGAYILYLDGHVDFVKYPGKWPMTEKTVRILNELDALGAQAP